MMRRQAFTGEDFVPLLGRVLGRPVRSVRVLNHACRPYSQIWFLDVQAGNETMHLVAKSWDTDAAFEKQVSAMRRARTTCSGKGVCIPYVGCIRHERLLLMTRADDPTVARLCWVSLRHPVRIPYLCDRHGQLEAACARAGRWLRNWHTQTTGHGLIAPAFEAYLTNRADCLDRISGQERDEILALAKNAGSGVTCIPHGDFTPANVLWSPQRLTVLDFGLSEWDRVSPWWDYVSFKIGLYRALRFSLKGLGMWSPGMVDKVIARFREGYGDLDGGTLAKDACLAVRHLVLYASDARSGYRYRRRAAWHQYELSRVLSGVN